MNIRNLAHLITMVIVIQQCRIKGVPIFVNEHFEGTEIYDRNDLEVKLCLDKIWN